MIKKLKSVLLICNKYYQYFRRANQNFDKPTPIYTKPLDGGVKVHLGAGPINIQGWINVDARSDSHIQLQSKGFDLNEFADGTVSEIYMCHALEHFSFSDAEDILRKFHKKLRVGGTLRISVPDFDSLVSVYQANQNNLELIKMALMGGQDYEYNFHKSVYNKELLSRLLTSCGYGFLETWDTSQDFGVSLGDWSDKSFSTPKGEFFISLNMKAVKSLD
ncbi:MAG: hypothetical protein ABII81_09680 [Pseudomonadota bacterium]